MAGRGNTIPKDPANRRRQNKDGPQRQVVSEDAELRGPDLPFGIEWSAQTRVWWENWRRSPQAQTFVTTDWDFLLDTALLHSQLWQGETAVAAELRLRLSKLGATSEDRRRLLITIEADDEPTAAPVRSINRRKQLKVV